MLYALACAGRLRLHTPVCLTTFATFMSCDGQAQPLYCQPKGLTYLRLRFFSCSFHEELGLLLQVEPCQWVSPCQDEEDDDVPAPYPPAPQLLCCCCWSWLASCFSSQAAHWALDHLGFTYGPRASAFAAAISGNRPP